MAQIPRIMPRERTITGETPGRTIKPNVTGDVISILGQTAQEVGNKIAIANASAERTRAQNARDSRLLELQNEADNDSDLSAARQKYYDGEIRKASSEAGKLISIPSERSSFQLESESKSQISKARIQGVFGKKIIAQGKADLDIYLSNKRDEFIRAQSAGEKQMAIIERDQKIREATRAGYIAPDDAALLTERMRREWAEGQVAYDIATAPQLAEQMLNAKKYPDISEEKRVEFLKDAKQAVNTNKKNVEDALKITQVNKGVEFVKGIASGKIGLADVPFIQELINDGTIDEKVGTAAIAAIQKPLIQDEIDEIEGGQYFLDRVNQLFDANDTEQINRALTDILNGIGANKAGRERLDLLMDTAIKAGGLDMRKGGFNPLNGFKKVGGYIKKGMGVMFEWIKEADIDTPKSADMTESYLKNISAGKTPQEAADISVQEEVFRQNSSDEKERVLDDDILKSITDILLNGDDMSMQNVDKQVSKYLVKTGAIPAEARQNASQMLAQGKGEFDAIRTFENITRAIPKLKQALPKAAEAIDRMKVFKEVLDEFNVLKTEEAEAAEPEEKNILDMLTDATFQTEGLLPGQTPLRITNEAMRKWNTIQGVPIDKNAEIPQDRRNFFFVDPGRVGEVIRKQWSNYLKKPERYGLTDKSTIEDVIKKFDQQNPKNKLKLLVDAGVDTKLTIMEIREAIENAR